MSVIARFQFLTHDSPLMTHAEQAELVCSAGGRWIQFRTKGKEYTEWRRLACEVQEVCRSFGATFLINDNVRIAKEIGADGVHLGKLDMPPREARTMLGEDFLIGGTANIADDLLYLHDCGVDYIGLGPYRFTQTKQNLSPVLGSGGIQRTVTRHRESSTIPVVAIGGIMHTDLMDLASTGVHGVALSSSILSHENPLEAVIEFVETMKEWDV